MDRNHDTSNDSDALLSDIDDDVLMAAQEIDMTLVDWLLSMSPLERVAWTMRQAMVLNGLRHVDE